MTDAVSSAAGIPKAKPARRDIGIKRRYQIAHNKIRRQWRVAL